MTTSVATTDSTTPTITASQTAAVTSITPTTEAVVSYPAGPCEGCGLPEVVPSPDLGVFTDQGALVAALLASGPLDNEKAAAVAQSRAPNESICASIVTTTDPTAGTLVHQATATFNGETGVVLVFEQPDGGREVRMYGVHDADPVTGGCPLWIKSDLSPEPATDETTSAAPASDESATIETEFGSVSYTVPAGSNADPRPPTPMPDFVLGQERWVVPDCCHVFVTLQNIEPPYPDEELVDTFVANGIEWNVYDTGPQNGTITTARGTDGPITVLVGAQGLFTDPPGPATLPITENVTRSVVIDLTGD